MSNLVGNPEDWFSRVVAHVTTAAYIQHFIKNKKKIHCILLKSAKWNRPQSTLCPLLLTFTTVRPVWKFCCGSLCRMAVYITCTRTCIHVQIRLMRLRQLSD